MPYTLKSILPFTFDNISIAPIRFFFSLILDRKTTFSFSFFLNSLCEILSSIVRSGSLAIKHLLFNLSAFESSCSSMLLVTEKLTFLNRLRSFTIVKNTRFFVLLILSAPFENEPIGARTKGHFISDNLLRSKAFIA